MINTFYFSLALQFLYEVSVPFNESSQDINFSLDIIFIQTQYYWWWLYVLTCVNIKLLELFNIFYSIVIVSNFRSSISYCLIIRKTEEQARLTLIGYILLKLARKCQLTFLTPKKVLRFYQHIYTNKLIDVTILLYFYIDKVGSIRNSYKNPKLKFKYLSVRYHT